MDLIEQVHTLPPELREKILSEVVKQKVADRNKIGWEEVHVELWSFLFHGLE